MNKWIYISKYKINEQQNKLLHKINKYIIKQVIE